MGNKYKLSELQHLGHAREQAHWGHVGDKDLQDKQAVTEFDKETTAGNIVKVTQN